MFIIRNFCLLFEVCIYRLSVYPPLLFFVYCGWILRSLNFWIPNLYLSWEVSIYRHRVYVSIYLCTEFVFIIHNFCLLFEVYVYPLIVCIYFRKIYCLCIQTMLMWFEFWIFFMDPNYDPTQRACVTTWMEYFLRSMVVAEGMGQSR